MLYLSGVVRPDMGAMLQPDMGNHPPAGQPWAADNGRYASPGRYSDERYVRFLTRLAPHVERCLFATAPDVVGDAVATLRLSSPMFEAIRRAGYPVALVAQDGLGDLDIPWAEFDALFVGGRDAWRRSESAHAIAAEAKARGKWVHLGRVNSLRRVNFAVSMGCDSVDGTHLRYSLRGGNAVGAADEVRHWVTTATRQTRLWQ